MMDNDKLELRALLLFRCNRSYTRDAGYARYEHIPDDLTPWTSAFDPRGILADVLCEAQSILADFAYSLNQRRTCCRLPAEILGMCLSFLPFHVRIRASRVSRAWRAAALATPSLWADISEYPRGAQLTVQALELALSRAIAVPLSLELGRELTGEKLELLQRSMHRVAYLQLFHSADTALLERRAPLLRGLQLNCVAELTTTFLSGCAGMLATVEAQNIRFLDSCRGLSNLTTLIVGRCDTVTLRDLFTMCPRLEMLEVKEVIKRNIEALGFPPASFRDLRLHTIENRAHLIPVLSAYQSASNLARVELHYRCASLGNVYGCYSDGCDASDLAPALHGVVSLHMDLAWPALYIEASFPGDRCVYLWLHHMFKDDWRDDFSPVFKQRGECFAQLRALTMPLFALQAFAADGPPTPSLSELVIYICEDFTFRGGVARDWCEHEYPWHMLRHLARVSPRRVELIVAPHDLHCCGPPGPPTPPTADEARALVAELARLAARLSMALVIRVVGFAADAVPQDYNLKPAIDLVFVSQSDASAPAREA